MKLHLNSDELQPCSCDTDCVYCLCEGWRDLSSESTLISGECPEIRTENLSSKNVYAVLYREITSLCPYSADQFHAMTFSDSTTWQIPNSGSKQNDNRSKNCYLRLFRWPFVNQTLPPLLLEPLHYDHFDRSIWISTVHTRGNTGRIRSAVIFPAYVPYSLFRAGNARPVYCGRLMGPFWQYFAAVI